MLGIDSSKQVTGNTAPCPIEYLKSKEFKKASKESYPLTFPTVGGMEALVLTGKC